MIINDIEELNRRLIELKSQNQKIVFTNGVFDLMHVGHLRYLTAAKALGDKLIVAVNSDLAVQRLKGPTRPIICEAEREEMLDGLRCVDFVTLFETDTPVPLVAKLQPQIYAKGGDYTIDRLPEAPIVYGYGGRVELLPFVDGRLSSTLIARIRDAYSTDKRQL